MRRSLRFRLAAAVVGVMAAALLTLSLVLYAIFAGALWRQFDSHLRGDAAAVAGMAEEDGGDGEFEYESLPEFERAVRPAYFQAWLDGGKTLARSTSLGTRDLARDLARGLARDPARDPARGLAHDLANDGATGGDAVAFAGVALPDGRMGRAVRLRQPLRVEGPAVAGVSPARASKRFVTVVVARGTEEVEGTLASVRHWILWLGLGGLGGASAVALLAVSRGLRPIRAVAGAITALDAGQLDRALPVDDLPADLAPLVARMNDLLGRLRESFAREKRFTADVSHELRTPLAALRTTLEVAASRDRSATEYRAAIDDARAVVLQMQALCENLLALARLDSGALPVRREEIDLGALVRACWQPFETGARARGLTFENQIAPAARVVSDPDQLRLVVTNLLSNAATYTACGGTIRVRAGERSLLEVHDSGPRIPDDVLAHVFERFFRGDATRAGGVHCGIGLALARGVADALGLSLTARNTPDGGVCFAVSPPAAG